MFNQFTPESNEEYILVVGLDNFLNERLKDERGNPISKSEKNDQNQEIVLETSRQLAALKNGEMKIRNNQGKVESTKKTQLDLIDQYIAENNLDHNTVVCFYDSKQPNNFFSHLKRIQIRVALEHLSIPGILEVAHIRRPGGDLYEGEELANSKTVLVFHSEEAVFQWGKVQLFINQLQKREETALSKMNGFQWLESLNDQQVELIILNLKGLSDNILNNRVKVDPQLMNSYIVHEIGLANGEKTQIRLNTCIGQLYRNKIITNADTDIFMREAGVARYSQHSPSRRILQTVMRNGFHVIECSYRDAYWGIAINDEIAQHAVNRAGSLLGDIHHVLLTRRTGDRDILNYQESFHRSKESMMKRSTV